MKKLTILALPFACAALMSAEEGQRVQKIVPIKTADVNQVYSTVRNLMGSSSMNIQLYQNNLILSGSAEGVAAAEQFLKNLESSATRERDVEVTGYIILATTQAGAAAANMPAELDPVLKQFRNLLNYKSFRVLDTIILRGRENSSMSSGGFLALPNSLGATAEFSVGRPNVTDDAVHLKDLSLGVHLPTSRVNDKGLVITTYVHIGTNTDIKAGQKVAIGKASVNSNGDAIILVVSATVVN